MINKFCKKPLWECSKTLSAVAQGLVPADTVIKGAKLVNVCTAEIQEDVDVAIAEGRIAVLENSTPLAASANPSPLSIGWGIDEYFALLAGALR